MKAAVQSTAVLAAALAVLQSANAIPVPWCTTSAEERAVCQQMVAILNADGAANEWSCPPPQDDCIAAIQAGTALAYSAGATDMFNADADFGAQLVMGETYGLSGAADPTEYYALAVVNEDLDVSDGWESLRGLASCHTGYQKTSGWTMPVGTLISEGVLQVVNESAAAPNDIETIQAFFTGGSCAPSEEEPPVDGVTGICGNCAGNIEAGGCTWTEFEPYQDYEGAFACLKAGAGDVAFTKQGIVPVAEQADYKLVCADGTTQPMTAFATCNLAAVPSHSILTGPDVTAAQITSMQADITAAAETAEFADLFFATAAGEVNPDSYIFSAETTGLVEVPSDVTTRLGTFGPAYAAVAAAADAPRTPAGGGGAAPDPVAPGAVAWCTISAAEQAKCEEMVDVINATPGVVNTYDCYQGRDLTDCISIVEEGTSAQLITLDGSSAFAASEESGIQIVVAESYENGAIEYYSLAVVRADSGIDSWADLKGKVSGHTGYGKTAGWFMPVGRLLADGVLTAVDANSAVTNDIEAVQAYFSASCAPGQPDELTGEANEGVSAICTACAGTCLQADSEPYEDYDGAIACLDAGDCDVAFTKEGVIAPADEANYKLLCPPGSATATAPLANYANCNLAVVPSHAVVTSPKATAQEIATCQADLIAAADTADFAALFFDGANEDGLVFDAGTQGLEVVTSSTRAHMGAAYTNYAAVRATENVAFGGVTAGSPAIWCVTSTEEMNKCEASLAAPLNDMQTALTFGCLERTDDDQCIAAIDAGSAHLITLDAGKVFDYFQSHGVQAVSAEKTDTEVSDGIEYYAVAVVRADAPDEFADYEGGRSCHTGYHKTSGWYMPLGELLSTGVLPQINEDPDVPNDIESIEAFFTGGSCAPGTAGDDGVSSICTNCKGDCTQTPAEPYQDYSGALLCLQEDAAGDDKVIAFVNHLVLNEVEASGYKLLCPNGGSAPLSEFATCNLATVPAHAVVTAASATQGYILAVQAALEAAKEDPTFAAAFIGDDTDGLILGSGLTDLTPVPYSTRAHLRDSYTVYSAVRALDTDIPVADDSGNDTEKALRDAVIALAVLLILCVLIAAWLIFRARKSNRRLSKELSKAQGFTGTEWNTTGNGATSRVQA